MRNARGAALVEAVFLCLILMIPVAWGLTVMDRVQRAALASTAAARDAGHVATSAFGRRSAQSAMESMVAAAFRDQELPAGSARLRWSAPTGTGRGEQVEIEVFYRVDVLGGWLPFASIPVRARHVTFLDPYASRGD